MTKWYENPHRLPSMPPVPPISSLTKAGEFLGLARGGVQCIDTKQTLVGICLEAMGSGISIFGARILLHLGQSQEAMQ